MRWAINAMAFLSSLAALAVIAGGGLTLLAVENSGERVTGALLAFGSFVAFAAVMALLFLREGTFAEGGWQALAIAAAIVGTLPVAVLAYTAIRFAGVPFDSPVPLLDWTVLALGALLGLGVIAILALGHHRTQEAAAPPLVHMQQIRSAQQQLRSAFESEQRRGLSDDAESEIRVRRV
jgi:hypothetical protein